MVFTASLLAGPSYLLVTTSGTADLAVLCGVCSFAAEAARRRGIRRVMFDLLAIEGDVGTQDRLALGAHMAATMRGLERVAVAIPPELHNGIAELAARSAGIDIKVLMKLDDASHWLQER